MPLLRSIVYVSDAIHELSESQLESLLVEAQTLNRRNGVTGVLLYNGGNIMQCLEGPEGVILSTYGRIQASRLHHNILELMNEHVERRSFQEWEMGLARPTASELLALSTARWKAQANTNGSALTASGLGLLQTFWQSARR